MLEVVFVLSYFSCVLAHRGRLRACAHMNTLLCEIIGGGGSGGYSQCDRCGRMKINSV